MAKAQPIDPELRSLLEYVADEIATHLKGEFFTCEGTPTVTVKYEDGTFKKKPIVAGWEFGLAYAYVGKSGKILIGFEPEDAQEYQYIELNAKEIEDILPLVGPAVANLFGVSAETEDLEVAIELACAKRLETLKEVSGDYTKLPNFGMF